MSETNHLTISSILSSPHLSPPRIRIASIDNVIQQMLQWEFRTRYKDQPIN